jgi:HAE1 family hydrophobic/amphiphilic exporter-1
MKLADVSIERPVFATMMILALVVLGLFSYIKLNIDQFPDVDFPYVTATTVLPGAGPEQIETDVTKKIEDAVNTIGGIDHIQSISQEGVSIIIIQFKLEVEGKQAAQDVREKIAAIRAELPNDVEDPVIQRIDPASQPIFTLTVSGDRSEKEITTFTKMSSKSVLKTFPASAASTWWAALRGKFRCRLTPPNCNLTISPSRRSSRAWRRPTSKFRPAI